MCCQVITDLGDPRWQVYYGLPTQDARSQTGHEPRYFPRSGNKAMIRDGANQRRRGLDRVDAIHTRGACRITARHEISREPQVSRCGAQQVTVDCQEHIYCGQVGYGIYRLIESEPRSFADIVPRNRLPLMPACLTVSRRNTV